MDFGETSIRKYKNILSIINTNKNKRTRTSKGTSISNWVVQSHDKALVMASCIDECLCVCLTGKGDVEI